MNIRQMLVSSSKYSIKCPYTMAPKYITIHNTANDASAANEVSYMINNNNEVSFHYAVDNKEAIQAIPEDRCAWHCGDGANGTGNRYSIGIEICYSKSGGDRFIQAEKNAAYLTAKLLKKYGWGIDKVKKHKDWSGKYCPHRTLDMGWTRFINIVKSELDKLNKPSTTPTPTPSTVYRVKVNDVQIGAYGNIDNICNVVKEQLKKGVQKIEIVKK